jgi:hypothetical protein
LAFALPPYGLANRKYMTFGEMKMCCI